MLQKFEFGQFDTLLTADENEEYLKYFTEYGSAITSSNE